MSGSAKEVRAPLPEPHTITTPPRDYQPTKAELEEEFDMLGANIETVHRSFFRPIRDKVEK